MNAESNERERARLARLRAALRENIKRRKSQARGRKDPAAAPPEDDRTPPADLARDVKTPER